jgi:hypothetical protein
LTTKQEKKEIQALTIDEVKAFMELAKETRHYPAYLLELTSDHLFQLISRAYENVSLIVRFTQGEVTYLIQDY